MQKRYKIRIIEIWDFKLNGTSKRDIENQILYIINKTKILNLREVKKRIKWKIKKINERNKKIYEENN